jgi:anti-sigma factor RsiW
VTDLGHVVNREARMDIADRILWRRSRLIDAAEDECGGFLDLAAFAEEGLDPDDRERVAEWLQNHPDAAADIAAARALASGAAYRPMSEASVARACAIVGGAGPGRRGSVVAFRGRTGRKFALGAAAQWGGLAAALVVTGWLGFTLGMDTSGMFARNGAEPDDAIAQELFGSSPGFFRDLTGGA